MNNNKTDFPLVSVIVACYNAGNYINECLDTILKQTYPNIEVIICDDNSTDNSYSILQNYAKMDERIILLRNQKNLFAAATRNRCIENSRGEYLLIQDIDDKSELNRVEVLLEHIKEEDISFVSSGMISFNNHDDLKYWQRSGPVYPKKKNFLWRIPFYHATTLFKRDCIEEAEGYRVSPETRRGQDYDLFMRLYALGFKGKVIEDYLYWYREDNAAIKRRTFSARIDEFKIRYKGFKKLGLFPIGYLFLLKPFFAYFYQLIKYWIFYQRN